MKYWHFKKGNKIQKRKCSDKDNINKWRKTARGHNNVDFQESS